MPDTMYEYYRRQEVLPTNASFRSPAQLEAYQRQRRDIFVHKLGLPPQVFRQARLLEFGPDSGENSLVFAQWGAACTLSEPNLRAHPMIREYFRRFELSTRLVALRDASITNFGPQFPQENYDIIDAEGFIYTVRPEQQWIDLFARLLDADGFVILTYLETYGSFLELLLKVIHRRMRALTGKTPLESARQVFRAKWDSIPHTRPLASWVMDVLDNPFVRLRYLFEPQTLCRQMHQAGFTLYSSWPCYKEVLNVDWVKKPWNAAAALQSQTQCIAQSRLSYFLGRTCFLPQPDPGLEQLLQDLVTRVDSLIDEFVLGRSAACRRDLAALAAVIGSDLPLIHAEDAARLLEWIASMQTVLSLLERGRVDELIAFCNSDEAFIRNWGSPSHWAVFCRQPGAADASRPQRTLDLAAYRHAQATQEELRRRAA